MSDRMGQDGTPDLASFRQRHASWLENLPDGPLYCLPEKAIDRLGQPNPRRAPFLNGYAVEAERDLRKLCQDKGVIGFDGDRAIAYPYLNPTLALPNRNDFPDLGWSNAQWNSLEFLADRTQQANDRLGGYAGWLATEPPFVEAVRDLAARWRDLPADSRPGFPLHRPATISVIPEGSSPSPEVIGQWAADYLAFCDRWGLIGMETWDLPLPQGPLLPSLVSPSSLLQPARSVYLMLPIHYNARGDKGLQATILEQQQSLAQQFGMDSSVAGLHHYKIYAQILKVVHLESTIRERYFHGSVPRGSVGILDEALAEGLNKQVDEVKRLQKMISKCQRGQRSSIRRLAPPKQP